MVKTLKKEEKQLTRKLWEEIFAEDTKQFLDYYYSEKVKENEVLAVYEKDEMVSMLHLNPYHLLVWGERIKADYIVAVATKEKYRHQGKMAELLKYAMKKAKRKQQPFVFLMPAKEAIYRPFGFVTVYQRKDYCLKENERFREENQDTIIIEEIEEVSKEKERESIKELAEFSEDELAKRYHVFAERNENYYQMLVKEQKSQNGSIVIGRKKQTGKICGYCFLAKEGENELREVVGKKELEIEWLKTLYQKFGENGTLKITGADFTSENLKETTLFPCIMVRITDFESFAGLIKLTEEEKIWVANHKKIKVEDTFFKENSGVYELAVIEKKRGYFLKAKKTSLETEAAVTINIEEIVKKSFKNLKIFLNEVV